MDNEEKQRQEQQQRNSSVDRVNDVINRARNARKNIRRGRAALNAVKTARTAATTAQATVAAGEAAVSTAPAWIPALIIGVIIFLIIVVFVVVFGGGAVEEEIPPVETPTCAGTCRASACLSGEVTDTSGTCTTPTDTCCLPPGSTPAPTPPPPGGVTPTCSNVDQLLLSNFGVRIKPVSEAVSCAVRLKIYRIYSIPTQSPRYLALLKPSIPFTLEFRAGTAGRTSGYTPNGSVIQLTGFASFIGNDSWFRLGSFFLIHETGHLIRHRNSFITSTYPNSILILNDPICYSSGYVITYSRAGTNKLSENMAESSALYVYNSKTGTYGTISNFRTQCDATYAWMKTVIYGDIIIAP